MEIHQAGGGIHFTVTHTKNASEEQLYESLKQRLESFSAAGILCSWFYSDRETKLKFSFNKEQRSLSASRAMDLNGKRS
jgi:imidazolonepropionase